MAAARLEITRYRNDGESEEKTVEKPKPIFRKFDAKAEPSTTQSAFPQIRVISVNARRSPTYRVIGQLKTR